MRLGQEHERRSTRAETGAAKTNNGEFATNVDGIRDDTARPFSVGTDYVWPAAVAGHGYGLDTGVWKMSDTAAVWELIEQAQGDIANTLRVMLKQPAHDPANFGPESQQRRIGAMQTLASDCRTEEQRHSAWMVHHESQGWKWGEHYSESSKTHPNLVAWEQLPSTEQAKIRIFHRMAQLGAALCEIFPRDTVSEFASVTATALLAVDGVDSTAPTLTPVPALDVAIDEPADS